MYRTIAVFAAAGLGFLAVSARADFEHPSAQAEAGPLAPAVLVSKIHMTNDTEMKVGQLAERKSDSAEVRRYGEQLYRDHRMADVKLLRYAKSHGFVVLPPEKLDTEAQEHAQKNRRLLQDLERASSPEFDQQFLTAMAKGHQEAIGMLTQAEPQIGDSQLRRMVHDLIPVLQQHQDIAEHLLRRESAGTLRRGG
jgi:putative membrane protein